LSVERKRKEGRKERKTKRKRRSCPLNSSLDIFVSYFPPFSSSR
jgi:hypothetical protein